MTNSGRRMSLGKTLFCGFAIVMGASSVGCTVQTGGQTLPSPYYLTDDVQYFAPGPEFYLQNEAAAMQLKKAEAEAQRAGQRRR